MGHFLAEALLEHDVYAPRIQVVLAARPSALHGARVNRALERDCQDERATLAAL